LFHNLLNQPNNYLFIIITLIIYLIVPVKMSVAHLRHSISVAKQFHIPLLNRFNCAHFQLNPYAKYVSANLNRTFHTTHPNSDTQASKLVQIGQNKVSVNQFGCLHINSSFIDLAVKPIDLNKYPNMDVSTCSFLSVNSADEKIPVLSNIDDKLSLTYSKVYEPTSSQCIVEIPLKYDVNLKDFNGKHNIDVRSMESALIDILTESGNISSRSLKGDVIKLTSHSGNINCQGVTQGNINFQSESGDIHGHRFQGPNLEITTSTGNISTESIYSEVSRFSSQDGNIHLKNLHRQCNVSISGSGNLTISGMDGSLDATLGSGTHQIQISQLHESSSLKVENGVLILKIPEQCVFGIHIRAKSLAVPEVMKKFTKEGDNGCTDLEYNPEQSLMLDIDATNSHVEVQFADWLASLGFSWK